MKTINRLAVKILMLSPLYKTQNLKDRKKCYVHLQRLLCSQRCSLPS